MGQETLTLNQLNEIVKEYVKCKELEEKLNINNIKVSFLAQGEYNINYIIEDKNQKYVMRLNTGSQMNLTNQIEYEYKALKYLEKSGVTPKVFYLDDSCKKIPLGILVMEYLPGRDMSYEKDLDKAAEVLAKVHQVEIKNNFDLIIEEKPLTGIWDECSSLLPVYLNSNIGNSKVKKILNKMLIILDDLRKKENDIIKIFPKSIVNTEVNSGNFIIDDKNNNYYLVDWEKPLITTPLQDLSHFSVPTTTLWKTDYKMDEKDRDFFIKTYCKERGLLSDFKEIKNRLNTFDKFSIMRGLSWSAMAWVNYQKEDRLLKNDDTFKKMDSYLKYDFIKNIFNEYYDS